jgi:hypothetical protein
MYGHFAERLPWLAYVCVLEARFDIAGSQLAALGVARIRVCF